jgi:hypothetical protein
MRIGKLPSMPAGLSFDHIQRLSMKDMAQNDDVTYFLKSFKQLESLELDNNKITRLPEVLSHMPKLKRLSLGGNQVKLTEHTLTKLNRLHTLTYLNLNNNPLGATPDVSQMTNLRLLLLRDTGITELPQGLQDRVHIEWMDLSKNKIEELPDWLFQKPRQFTRALNLALNPFTETSKTYLDNYRNNYGIGMGYTADDIVRLSEQTARSLWLTKTAGEEWLTQVRIWEAFRGDTSAEGLLQLLARLGDTADGTKGRADMQRRIWAVLKAAEADGPLCDELLDLAANRINCDDTAAIIFSHLEVAVHVDHVTKGAGGKVTAKPLLELGRRLFRLHRLNEIAHEHAVKVGKLDEVEVNLAYRIGLAKTLDLPGQPQNMLLGLESGVTAADLEKAQHRITSDELSPKWLEFMQQQTFWRDYLKRTFTRKFSLIDESFDPRMSALDEQVDTLPSDDYVSQGRALKLQKEQAQEAEFKRLTQESIRLMDMGLCVMPDM